MKFTRKQLIGGVIGVVIVATAVYAGWYFVGRNGSPYPGHKTTMEVSMDEATRTYLTDRFLMEKAAIAAYEQKGETVDLDLVLSAANDAYSIGDLVSARQLVERQLQGNSNNYTAWNFYGTVLESMGDYDGARTAFKKAMDSGVAVEEFYRDYITLLQNHFSDEQAEIKRALEQSVAERGQSSWNMVELGRFYAANGDCVRSVDHYNVAVTLAPQNQSIKDELAKVRQTCGK